ncbi:hypothetical protein T03_16486 [Trichinella britovi]|uniref:Uncharacterized protein n=1 Tax=Trichinella britovi TaxID=45882 RepID=A0A0V1C8H3_TRIBR|nr:hypothetical protein T03_16486 [Trichinella britovi]
MKIGGGESARQKRREIRRSIPARRQIAMDAPIPRWKKRTSLPITVGITHGSPNVVDDDDQREVEERKGEKESDSARSYRIGINDDGITAISNIRDSVCQGTQVHAVVRPQ